MNKSRLFLDALKGIFKLPLRLVNAATILSKNAIYIMTLILLADYLYLRNQILKRQYKQLTGRMYVPLHSRLGELVGNATFLSLPSPNQTRSLRIEEENSPNSLIALNNTNRRNI